MITTPVTFELLVKKNGELKFQSKQTFSSSKDKNISIELAPSEVYSVDLSLANNISLLAVLGVYNETSDTIIEGSLAPLTIDVNGQVRNVNSLEVVMLNKNTATTNITITNPSAAKVLLDIYYLCEE